MYVFWSACFATSSSSSSSSSSSKSDRNGVAATVPRCCCCVQESDHFGNAQHCQFLLNAVVGSSNGSRSRELSTDADRRKNRREGEEGRERKRGERAKEEGEGLLTKMAPPEGGIHVLDGSGIREGLANGNVIAKERFAQSDEGGKGHLTTAELRRAAEAEAAALLLGARIQSQILDRAFDTAVVDQGSEQEVDEQAFAAVLENYLLAIADSLDGEKIFSFSNHFYFIFLAIL
jgi:hypothetical protein